MKKLFLIKKVGFIATLFLSSNLVSANDYVLGDISFSTIDTSFLSIPEGAFTDRFRFTLSEENFFSALATSSITSISAFTDISLEDMIGTIYDVSGIFSIAEFTEASTGEPTFLDAGSYVLSISGIASAESTGYTLNTVTSPVSEPNTIVLMLGGLGLIGFMAARRRNQSF